jgi:hypothetical protein
MNEGACFLFFQILSRGHSQIISDHVHFPTFLSLKQNTNNNNRNNNDNYCLPY